MERFAGLISKKMNQIGHSLEGAGDSGGRSVSLRWGVILLNQLQIQSQMSRPP